MYARLSTFRIAPGTRQRLEALADQLAPRYQGMAGFKGVWFFIDEVNEEAGSFSLWNTRAEAEAAVEATATQLREALTQLALEMPNIRVVEVYEPPR